MNVSELFWDASLEDLKRGFVQDEENFICLLCGRKIEKGIIYPEGEVLYEASKYMAVHIEKEHTSVFDYLSGLDKKITGLSEHQSKLIKLFYQGKTDAEVQAEMGIGSSSTIRNHRFALKEKERQAKVFLVMMELLRARDGDSKSLIKQHNYKVTVIENQEIIKKFFPEGVDGPLKTFSMKEKYKLVVLREIAKRFEIGRVYNEKEVNEILKNVYERDHITVRRYLIEYGFLERKPDGSQYWLKSESEKKGKMNMDRKAELKQMYKEMKTEAGVYLIRNTKNGKIYVESTKNLKTINGKKIEMERGNHWNTLLKQDLKEFGPDAFEFEILEVLEKKEEGFFDEAAELKKLEEKWLNKLQPYGERGYNKKKD